MHRQNNYKDSSSEKEQDSKFPLSPIPSRDVSTYVYWVSEYLWVSGLEIGFFFNIFFTWSGFSLSVQLFNNFLHELSLKVFFVTGLGTIRGYQMSNT